MDWVDERASGVVPGARSSWSGFEIHPEELELMPGQAWVLVGGVDPTDAPGAVEVLEEPVDPDPLGVAGVDVPELPVVPELDVPVVPELDVPVVPELVVAEDGVLGVEESA
jgi:hypothetical protein